MNTKANESLPEGQYSEDNHIGIVFGGYLDSNARLMDRTELNRRIHATQKGIERLKSATDPYYMASVVNLREEIERLSNENVGLRKILQNTNEILEATKNSRELEKLKELLIQARPWVSERKQYSGIYWQEEELRVIEEWEKQYNELMGEENK